MVERQGSVKPAKTGDKLLRAAAKLLDSGGIEAVSTRAVAAAAGVQPPLIYRQYGDMSGFLDAVTHYVMQQYTEAKKQILAGPDDPIDQLRKTWELHVRFGLEHPHAYVLAFAAPSRDGTTGAAAQESIAMLYDLVAQLGAQGKLCMSVARAAQLLYATGVGITLSLIQVPSSERDYQLFNVAFENVLDGILVKDKRIRAKDCRIPARAVALAEVLRGAKNTGLTAGERALLIEWLSRLADHGA